MNLNVYTPEGAASTSKNYAIPEFEGDKGLKALRQVVLAYLANRRQGTSSTKTHSTVSGTGKKPFRQKGTGRARQGSLTANQHYHGSVAHGPQPRDWSQKIQKKLRRLALRRALYDRAVAGEIDVIEKWEVAEAKTKRFNSVVENIAPAGRLLLVDDSWSDGTALAARNIARLTLTEADSLNALDLCDYHRIIISEKGIEKLLSRANGGEAQ